MWLPLGGANIWLCSMPYDFGYSSACKRSLKVCLTKAISTLHKIISPVRVYAPDAIALKQVVSTMLTPVATLLFRTSVTSWMQTM